MQAAARALHEGELPEDGSPVQPPPRPRRPHLLPVLLRAVPPLHLGHHHQAVRVHRPPQGRPPPPRLRGTASNEG